MLDDFKLESLKTMSNNELEQLASEIRNKIIETTSRNGGHLASNLGVVELTIALHKVFDTPKDKIIFDVSHQTYTHKLLTGRYKEFDTLRKFNGLSGFAKMNESKYDAFEAGHSSTSISAGLGFIEAKKTFPNEIGEVIAVVGDASVSNGLCFEALNYLGAHPKEKMIIIINDNNMSVSANVGTVANKYNSLRIKKSMNWLKRITPVRIKHALQYYAYKVDLFTSLDLKYFENIDGHDFNELIKYLTYAKNYPRTIVLHIKTTKGKGYPFAENDKLGIWHGVGPFDVKTGAFKCLPKSLTFGEVLAEELINQSKKDENQLIRVISPAMILGSGISKYASTYPKQTIDVGIAEEQALVMASSMAISGLKPVVFIYSTFLQRGYDELIHDIARTNVHVVLCVDRAGIVPGDGDTHQGIYDMAFCASIPGLTILQPTSALDASKMLDYALNRVSGPVIIRYPKGQAPLNDEFFDNSLMWKEIIKGDDYVITYGPDVFAVKKAIEGNHLNVGLIDALSTTPIDTDLLNHLGKKPRTLFIYENVISNGSLANSILSYVNENDLNMKIKSISIKDGYLKSGSTEELKEFYHVSINDLVALIKRGK